MHLKMIRTQRDYDAAMIRLTELMGSQLKPGSAAAEELEVLGLIIEAYEKTIVPEVKADPIESILFRMDQMNLTRKDLERYIGSASKVSEVLSRKRPLSLPMIRRLHEGLGIPADVLIRGSDISEDLVSGTADLEYERFPIAEMAKRRCFGSIKYTGAKLKDNAEQLIRKFFDGFESDLSPSLLRAPLHQRGSKAMDQYALMAWRVCVLKRAEAKELTGDYQKGVVTSKWLRDLAKLSAFEQGPQLAEEHLSRYGIALVVEPHFRKTFLDGAVMLHKGRPVIGLTLRHDRLDNFWFALFHELAHLAKHIDEKHPVYVDDLDDHTALDAAEVEADEIASEALIPEAIWNGASVRKTKLASEAQDIAKKLGIHPAIIAGRLRFETKDFSVLSSLVGKKGQVSRFFNVVN